MHLYFVGFAYGLCAIAPLLFVVFAARALKADADARQAPPRNAVAETRAPSGTGAGRLAQAGL